ncbi:hypothetical protein V5O48_009771 [Marasmius crinis-equi]|uniref:CCHC-type domain-containing protein n=1 Tax=Marasmius crinis-equi TaxID=585013 RepID=A0ABR3FA87_9AGAR
MSDLSEEAQSTVSAMINAKFDELLQRIQNLGSPQPPPPTQPPPTSPPPTAPTPFVGPLTNPAAAGTLPSQSLLSRFPEVESATITAIINHEFRAYDLYKLDSRYRDKTERQVLSLKGETLELTTNDSAFKEYKSLSAVAVPLSTYFLIILTHAEAAGRVSTIAIDFFHYNAHLVKIASEYEWSAVVGYHMAFFNKRRREMQAGDYSGWGRVDLDLRGEYIYNAARLSTASKPSKKPSSTSLPSNRSEPCRNFNTGKCSSSPCPYGRPHTCTTCGKSGHGAHDCPTKSKST